MFLCILVCVPCLLQGMRKMIERSVSAVFLVKQKGGDVGMGISLTDIPEFDFNEQTLYHLA